MQFTADEEIDPNPHLVIPGQKIAQDDAFLRGHGTFLAVDKSTVERKLTLYAAVTGTVERVNQLLHVDSIRGPYIAQTGDLIVGRVVDVQASRWMVQLTPDSSDAALPLASVYLASVGQRVRTAEDARDMHTFFTVGDLLSAEVQKTVGGTALLHTRSARYGKLENGCMVQVPSHLVPRRKSHFLVKYLDAFQVLWGCNGMIWIQRKLESSTVAPNSGNDNTNDDETKRQKHHVDLPYSNDERESLARLRNSIECLRLTSTVVSPENVEHVFRASEGRAVKELLIPSVMIELTEALRNLQRSSDQ